MDITKLLPEERQCIIQLVRSPGWALVMSKFCIPKMQSATARLDALSGVTQSQADIMRGVKHAYKQLIEVLYLIAEVPNPFEQHVHALLTTVMGYSTPTNEVPYVQDEQKFDLKSELASMSRRRTSYPV